LLKRRPDIREAERQLASATAEIGVATAQLYLDIQLAASLGSVGVTRDAFTSPTNYFGVGAVLNWQANRSAARARIAEAEASTILALANFDGRWEAAGKWQRAALRWRKRARAGGGERA
jgi:outer membrane protein TolC